MRFRIATPITLRAAMAGAVVAMNGCASAPQPGISAPPSVAAAGSYYSFADALALHEARTISFALDRIDQRILPLDHVYRHAATGRGVTVYVFDGGVSPKHPELAGRVRVGYSAFPDDPTICNAHGTAVAGAIAGTNLGVAPDAQIVDVKMVRCDRLRATINGIVDGAHWVIEDHHQHPGPAVVNWSFIADTAARIPALDSAVAALRAAGIAVIVSAGNIDINACLISPGNADGTIVVGATSLVSEHDVRDSTILGSATSLVSEHDVRGGTNLVDIRAPGTAWGPCVDVYAPGDSVLLPSLDRDLQTPTTQLWNGTSMSAGYVSGAAALYLEMYPTATPDDVGSYIRRSATENLVRDARSPVSRLLYVGAPRSRD